MLFNMLDDLKDSLSEKDRTTLLRYLNRAYREIYDTYDLPNAVADEYFQIDGTDGQIALPEYVDQIRGAGAETQRVPISVADFRSGYRVTPVFQQPYEWRVRGTVALSGQMDATDQIRIVLQGTETSTVNVYVTGRTATSAEYTETITFEPGVTSQTTVTQWLADDPYALKMIAKDVPTLNDVLFYVNSTGTEICRLRNRYLSAKYVLLQISDQQPAVNLFAGPITGARIVYKKQFSMLFQDTDEVIYPKIEDAVVWKARELWFGSQDGQDAQASAVYAYQKCQALLNTIVINQESESEKKVLFGRDKTSGAWRYGRRRDRYANFYR